MVQIALRTFVAVIASVGLVNAGDVIVQHNDEKVSYAGGGWSKVFNGWCSGVGYSYSSNQPSWATLYFQGTAIQAYLLRSSDAAKVYILVDNHLETANSGTDLWMPSVAASSCNYWTFQKTGLPWGNHSITVTNIGDRGDTLYLHKFVYTVPENPQAPDALPSGSGSSSKGPLIGGIVGGILGAAILGGLIWFFGFRKRRHTTQPPTAVSNDGSYGKAEASDVQSTTTSGQWQPDPRLAAAINTAQPYNPYQSIATMNYSPPPPAAQLPMHNRQSGTLSSFNLLSPQEMDMIQTLARRGDVPGGTIDALIARILAEKAQAQVQAMSTNTTGPGGPSTRDSTPGLAVSPEATLGPLPPGQDYYPMRQ